MTSCKVIKRVLTFPRGSRRDKGAAHRRAGGGVSAGRRCLTIVGHDRDAGARSPHPNPPPQGGGNRGQTEWTAPGLVCRLQASQTVTRKPL